MAQSRTGDGEGELLKDSDISIMRQLQTLAKGEPLTQWTYSLQLLAVTG